jgi:hypothetical protein
MFWCAADAMVSTGLAEQGYTYINIGTVFSFTFGLPCTDLVWNLASS